MKSNLRKVKLGIGWRPEIALAISRQPDLQFVEIVAENFMDMPALPPSLMQLKEQGVEIMVHCISLSLGGANKPDTKRLSKIKRLARATGSKMVSDHVCFVRAKGLESGHLLPVPRTTAALNVLVDNILYVKDRLELPFSIENIASICNWKNSYLDEADFISEILERTDSGLLLDVANLYANCVNHHFDPVEYLKRLPLERIAYVHMAGGVMRGDFYHDTHAHAIPQSVFELLGELTRMTNLGGVMLERDDRFPSEVELCRELNRLHAICANTSENGASLAGHNNRSGSPDFLRAMA